MGLQDAARRLAAIARCPLRAFSTFDFGCRQDTRARSVVVPRAAAEGVLLQVRSELSPGVIAFIGTTRWLGDERHEGAAEILVAEGATQFDILRVARSDAVNYDMGTEDLVRKLQTYDEEFGIDIIHAETDTIEFDLVGDPENFSAFAADLYEFCPDIVDQGVGSVADLEEQIMVAGRVFLWWD
jgi:hypothetical protein